MKSLRHPLTRRAVLAGAAALAMFAPTLALAQQRRVIGWLATGTPALNAPFRASFVRAMRDLGHLEGRDYDIVARHADGQLDRLPALAADIVALRPNLILVASTPGAIALRQATTTIPVVAATMSDPVGFKLIESHARPGGNITGIVNYVETLPGKLMSFAREAVPGATRMGLMLNLGSPQHAIYRRDAGTAATALGITLVVAEVREAGDLDAAFASLVRERVDLALYFQDALFLNQRRRLADLAAAARLPAIYSFREHVEDGGLMSYGQNLVENYKRAAFFVDRILKGANPATMPVEFPTAFELVVNLKTASALGLAIPQTVLIRADEVIE